MINTQNNMVSGSVYADALTSASENYKGSRMPRVGQKVVFDDGREFVFGTTAVNMSAGDIAAQASCQVAVIANLCTAASAGDYAVTIDTTAVAMFGGAAGVIAADKLNGGYLVTSLTPGHGYSYRIKTNTAGTATAAVTVTLFDPLKVALTTGSDVYLVSSRYSGLVAGTATLVPVGIAVVPSTAATSGLVNYLWFQTKGIAAVKITTGASIAVGKTVVADATAGVKVAGAVTDMVIGASLVTSTNNGDIIPVVLNIGA